MNVATDEADVLARIVRWADAQDSIRIVLLTSSRANPQAPLDILSDYDIILVASDTGPHVRRDGWLRGVGNPLLCVRDAGRVDGLRQHNYMVLYDDGTKIDYSVWPLAVLRRIRQRQRLPEELDLGYRVILDKDDLMRELPSPTYTAHIPRQPTAQEYRALVEEFWFCTTYVAKFLWRGELMPVKVILDYEMKFLLVRRLLEWRMELDHAWSLKPGFFGRGLQAHLAPDIWAQLEETYVGADPEANWTALDRTIGLFRRVAIEVGEALGYEYPHAVDAQMMTYLGQIRRL